MYVTDTIKYAAVNDVTLACALNEKYAARLTALTAGACGGNAE